MKKINSMIGALLVACSAAMAQIPNNGFENWTNMGNYNNPDGWDNLNAMTSGMSVYTCTKGTPGNPGASYLKLVSKNVSGMGVMPGVAATGTLNTVNMTASGFAYSTRSQNLTGSWQYMAAGADQGFISVLLTKWNSGMNMRDTVAYTSSKLAGMAMSWANFTLPLTYLSGTNPDTAVIILSASGTTPVSNSYLYVDNLSFTGTVTGIKESKAAAPVKLFPNPAGDKLIVKLADSKNTKVQMEVYNMMGNKIRSLSEIDLSAAFVLDISELAKGQYILKLITSEGVIDQKFIKE